MADAVADVRPRLWPARGSHRGEVSLALGMRRVQQDFVDAITTLSQEDCASSTDDCVNMDGLRKECQPRGPRHSRFDPQRFAYGIAAARDEAPQRWMDTRLKAEEARLLAELDASGDPSLRNVASSRKRREEEKAAAAWPTAALEERLATAWTRHAQLQAALRDAEEARSAQALAAQRLRAAASEQEQGWMAEERVLREELLQEQARALDAPLSYSEWSDSSPGVSPKSPCARVAFAADYDGGLRAATAQMRADDVMSAGRGLRAPAANIQAIDAKIRGLKAELGLA